jgi:hypothetical protein
MTQGRKSYCIICGKEKDGIEIREDNVSRAIRTINGYVRGKRLNNRVVVCKECYPKYNKYRKRYISRQRLYLILGVAVLVVSMLLSPSIGSLLFSVMIIILLYLLSLINWLPALSVSRGSISRRKAEPVSLGEKRKQ